MLEYAEMRYPIALAAACLASATAFALQEDGPSMADLGLLRVPAEEIPGGENELATKLDFARAFILAGKPAEAFPLLDEVAARDLAGTFAVEVLYYRGFAHDMMGEYKDAVASYNAALEKRPGDVSVTLALGQAYLDWGKGDEAKAAFEAALAASPEDSQALTGLGYLDLASGDAAAAQAKIERAVAADATNALAYSYLGLLEMQQKRFDVAREHLEIAVVLEPNSLTANYNLGGICFMQGEYAAAEGYYRTVVRLKADDAQARFYLALSLEAQGRYADAMTEADAVVKSGQKINGVVEMMDRLERKLHPPK